MVAEKKREEEDNLSQENEEGCREGGGWRGEYHVLSPAADCLPSTSSPPPPSRTPPPAWRPPGSSRPRSNRGWAQTPRPGRPPWCGGGAWSHPLAHGPGQNTNQLCNYSVL